MLKKQSDAVEAPSQFDQLRRWVTLADERESEIEYALKRAIPRPL
jgi:hypothetical protein